MLIAMRYEYVKQEGDDDEDEEGKEDEIQDKIAKQSPRLSIKHNQAFNAEEGDTRL